MSHASLYNSPTLPLAYLPRISASPIPCLPPRAILAQAQPMPATPSFPPCQPNPLHSLVSLHQKITQPASKEPHSASVQTVVFYPLPKTPSDSDYSAHSTKTPVYHSMSGNNLVTGLKKVPVQSSPTPSAFHNSP